MSFVVMIFERPCTSSGQDAWQAHEHVREGVHNALTFATVEEARTYAVDLSGRWFGFDHWAIFNDLGQEVLAEQEDEEYDDGKILIAGVYDADTLEEADPQ